MCGLGFRGWGSGFRVVGRRMRNLSGSPLRPLKRIELILHLEGHGDLVSRLVMGIIGVIIWLIGMINLLTKSP